MEVQLFCIEFASLSKSTHLRAMSNKRLAIIGGGAAGFFAAIQAASRYPDWQVVIFEKSKTLLGKVKISGGGRCNVTHACFEPKELIRYYPRGSKELLGPFHVFQPGDMFDWLQQRGVELKTEEDGRVFPISDSSQTIIDCFLREAKHLGVEVITECAMVGLHEEMDKWHVQFANHTVFEADAVIITTGSSKQIYQLMENLDHKVVDAVPSLFTFNVTDSRIENLAGVSASACEVKIEGTKFVETGPVLITHWGFSGPGILKLSAFAARVLHDIQYDFTIRINWDTRFTVESCLDYLKEWRQEHNKQMVTAYSPVKVPHRLWCALISKVPRIQQARWADVSNKQLEEIAAACCDSYWKVNGKSTFKDEFVTAGGVALSEVDFRTMQSKRRKSLFFAGEVLDIDAVTGGFNFQAAWTTAYIAANHIGNVRG